MTYLTALLPVADGVATWAALDRRATLAKAAGDRRTRGQLMADELTHRLLTGTASPAPAADPMPTPPTGRPDPAVLPTTCRMPAGEPAVRPAHPAPGHSDSADTVGTVTHRPKRGRPAGDSTSRPAPPHDPTPPRESPAVPSVRQIDLMLVMTDRALLDGADTAALIPGHGPIPAALARGMLADADPATRIFLRRLYSDPTGQHLLSADARGRLFPHAVRQFVLARDQRCRTPFCDAPIRHIDHTVPHSAGGPTTLDNTGGLCERCSLTKGPRTDTEVRPGPPPSPPRSSSWDRPVTAITVRHR